MNAQQVADELGVTERTVRRWIERGWLEAEKRGGEFAIDIEEARQLLPRKDAGAIALAELRGRYLEVKERLAEAEAQLAHERERVRRLEAIVYPPAVPEERAF